MTHDDLIKRAFSWLQNQKGCSIVASELVTGITETPDVIGWNGWTSILIEAKVSLSDFRADQKKIFRKLSDRGMGVFRYYIVPLELRDKVVHLLPYGWGLLSMSPRRKVLVEKQGLVFQHNQSHEILFLSSVIRRIAMKNEPLRGINVRCYTYQADTEPKAELFVEPDSVPNTEISAEVV